MLSLYGAVSERYSCCSYTTIIHPYIFIWNSCFNACVVVVGLILVAFNCKMTSTQLVGCSFCSSFSKIWLISDVDNRCTMKHVGADMLSTTVPETQSTTQEVVSTTVALSQTSETTGNVSGNGVIHLGPYTSFRLYYVVKCQKWRLERTITNIKEH